MRTIRSLSIVSLVCLTLPLSGCMGGSGSRGNSLTLEQQVQQHDAQLRQMQPTQADVWNQLQALRQDLNAIKGQMDDLRNVGGAQVLAERVQSHDEALRQVERSMALNLNLGAPVPATPVGATPVAQPESLTQAGSLPSYGLPAATADTGQSSQPVEPVINPSSSTWGQPSPQPQPQVQVPQKDISLALFDAGVNAYNARKYDEAQRSFSDFLKNYKNHSQAAEAQFYLAECYFQRNQFADAALSYDTVIKQYPKSSSAPGAYLKQGISFSKLNQGAAARARMQELITRFPNSPEAARAKSFLKTNK